MFDDYFEKTSNQANDVVLVLKKNYEQWLYNLNSLCFPITL